MSKLTYNGLVFDSDGWQTLGFNQEAIYDESNTDLECVKITIAGHCVLSQCPGRAPFLPGAVGDPAATALAKTRLTSAFMKPQQSISFTVNGTEMMPSSSTIDARNGPRPLRCNVISITEGAFLCDVAIESHWVETSPAGSDGDGNQLKNEVGQILSHRWSETAKIDLNFYTTKTRTGKIVVSSAAYNSKKGIFLDKLRETLITTSIEPGFVRLDSQYTVHPNGLEMRYSIVDQERFRLPPAPASDAEGDYTITTQMTNGPGRFVTCRIKLTGPKKVQSNPGILMKAALGIALNQCRKAGGFFPTKVDFHEQLYRNEVEVMVAGRLNQQKRNRSEKKTLNLEAGLKNIGMAPLGSERGLARSPDPGTRGTANLLLRAAAFHDPSLGQTLDRTDNSVSGGIVPGG